MKQVALLITAIILATILFPIGLIVRMFYSGKKIWLYKVAVSIDQMGNVVCDKLFNVTLIKKNGYQFGCEDETISSVIGKNELSQTLTIFGISLAILLNAIDKNHTTNAIGN